MFYSLPLTIPANTTEADAQEVDLKLAPGVIHRVGLTFPAGCVGLAHARILRSGHQLWPTNPDQDFALDDTQVEWDDYFELNEDPFSVLIQAWNQDDTYAHTITVRIGVVPIEVFWREGRSARMIEVLTKAFGLVPEGS
ncbi:MAG: hypothetical protein M1531_09145 [Chloroflexi bacterium]|nr:hypothetical protein [Chloroflexota bacterium]